MSHFSFLACVARHVSTKNASPRKTEISSVAIVVAVLCPSDHYFIRDMLIHTWKHPETFKVFWFPSTTTGNNNNTQTPPNFILPVVSFSTMIMPFGS
jgi:hypothetical protein